MGAPGLHCREIHGGGGGWAGPPGADLSVRVALPQGWCYQEGANQPLAPTPGGRLLSGYRPCRGSGARPAREAPGSPAAEAIRHDRAGGFRQPRKQRKTHCAEGRRNPLHPAGLLPCPRRCCTPMGTPRFRGTGGSWRNQNNRPRLPGEKPPQIPAWPLAPAFLGSVLHHESPPCPTVGGRRRDWEWRCPELMVREAGSGAGPTGDASPRDRRPKG